MKKNIKRIAVTAVTVAIFAVTFSVGVFNNPNFNIQDFCMNMASELLGIAIALTIVEVYVRERRKAREEKHAEIQPGADANQEGK